MRPISIEFQAFGPYTGYEKVDFEALSKKGLFLICGKTGIGKTMILDAITFALFGKSSGHGRDDFEAMRCTNADFDKDTFVKFKFENHGELYLFERRLERKRKNLSPSYNVAKKDDDGIWRPLMENPKEKAVNEKAVSLIGLEYDQFRQVIVLPQGQFEKLLTSNSDEKEKILTSIFGEEKWQVIADTFYAKAEKRKSDLREIQEQIKTSLAEEDCDSISQLELEITHKRDSLKELEQKFKTADYDSVIKELQNNLSIANRFGDLHKAENDLSELEAKADKRAGWEKTLNEAKRAEKIKPLMDAEEDAKEALRKRKEAEDSVRKDAEEKKKMAENAAEKLKMHLESAKEIENLKKQKIQYEGKREDYEGIEDLEKDLKNKKEKYDVALKAEDKAKKDCAAYTDIIVKLHNEYTSLKKEHDELLKGYLVGITGELAAKLENGKPCPVCGSIEHPNKATVSENSISKAKVDSKKEEFDDKYDELQRKTADQEKANKLVSEKHAIVETANTELATASAQLESRKKSLVPGIESLKSLDAEINRLNEVTENYEKQKELLTENEKKAKEALTEAKSKVESAVKETGGAEKAYTGAQKSVEKGLKENGFESAEEAEKLMLSETEIDELSKQIADYDAKIQTSKEHLKSLEEELKGKKEPDKEKSQEKLDEANDAKVDYEKKKAVLEKDIERLQNKADTLKVKGDGIVEKIREADEDFIFAKKLRGDSGTGLQRYVLGIMFSSVVAAANNMLEMVHEGRYRLYRSDDKAQGSNKRGLELKVYDKNSEEHDGRFVSTLSGGEKFLASLALSIGMSTVAQRSGIKIEALFIDEGFGSLDDESIADAMSVLNSIQEANGLVGIISHVQLLQDQIPSKLRVEEDDNGSHIVQTVG